MFAGKQMILRIHNEPVFEGPYAGKTEAAALAHGEKGRDGALGARGGGYRLGEELGGGALRGRFR
jgi:hypothetical protein